MRTTAVTPTKAIASRSCPSYLTQLQRATAEGVPVRGCVHRSIRDNFEWLAAYKHRYQRSYLDDETQTSTPQPSASFYRELIACNAVAETTTRGALDRFDRSRTEEVSCWPAAG